MNCPSARLRIAAWLTVLLWAATIHWFSSRTGPEIEELNVFDLSDKAAHFIAFLGGAPPLVCALRWSFAWSWRKIAVTAAIALALYGAADEYHQTFTPNRTGADPLDWMADALGGMAGAVATTFLYARSQGPYRTAPAGD